MHDFYYILRFWWVYNVEKLVSIQKEKQFFFSFLHLNCYLIQNHRVHDLKNNNPESGGELIVPLNIFYFG